MLRAINDAGGEFGTPGPTDLTSTFSNANPGTYDTHYHYSKAGTLAFYGNRGVKVIRTPFRLERLFAPDGAIVAAERDRLTAYLNNAQTAGVVVRLDAHNYGAYWRHDGTQGVRRPVGTPEFPVDTFALMCRRVYETWGAHVAFDGLELMNEPVDLPESLDLTTDQALNGGFEVDTSDWVAAANTTLARDTTRAHAGTAAGTLTAVAAGDVAMESVKKSCSLGQKIAAEAFASHDGTARTVGIQINWFTSGGVYISTSNGRFAADTTGFTVYRIEATAPTVATGATADAAQYTVKLSTQTLAASEVHRFDSIRFGPGALVTGAKAWEAASKKAVAAIREVNTTKRIYVDGYFYSSTSQWATNHPSWWISDSLSVPSPHIYLDGTGAGHYAKSYDQEVTDAINAGFTAGNEIDALVARGVARFKPYKDWAIANGVRTYVSEVGWPSENYVTAAEADRWAAYGTRMYQEFGALKSDVAQWASGEWWNATNENLAYRSSTGASGVVDTVLRAARVLEGYVASVVSVPGAPTITGVTAGDGSATVSFSGPGGTILEYEVVESRAAAAESAASETISAIPLASAIESAPSATSAATPGVALPPEPPPPAPPPPPPPDVVAPVPIEGAAFFDAPPDIESRYELVLTTVGGEPISELPGAYDAEFAIPVGSMATGRLTVSGWHPDADFLLAGEALLKVYEVVRYPGETTTRRILHAHLELITAEEQGDGSKLSVATTWADPFWTLARRLIGKSTEGYSSGITSPKDYGSIILEALNALNAESPTGVAPGVIVGGARASADGWRYRPFGPAMAELLSALDAPEWRIRPVEYETAGRTGLGYIGRLDVKDALGRERPDVALEYGDGRLNVGSFQRGVSREGQITRAYHLPPGFPEDPTRTVLQQDAAARPGRRLLETVLPEALTADDLRRQLLAQHIALRANPRTVVNLTMANDPSGRRIPRLGVDFNVGDVLPFRASAMAPDGSLRRRLNVTVRVYQATLNVDRGSLGLQIVPR